MSVLLIFYLCFREDYLLWKIRNIKDLILTLLCFNDTMSKRIDMETRNKQKIEGRIDEVKDVGVTYCSLINKLITLHVKYTEMIEDETYPNRAEIKKMRATIKRVERSLRLTEAKFKHSYGRLIEDECGELKIIKDTLKGVD